MNDTYEYYWQINTRIDDYSEYEPSEQKVTPKRAFCKRCHNVLDDWYPKPLEIELQNLDFERAVSLRCRGRRRGIVRHDVIHYDVWRQVAHLCPTAARGKVGIWKGEFLHPTDDWVSVLFPPSELVHVRGVYEPEKSVIGGVVQGVCTVCGRQGYLALNDLHLVRCQIPEGRPVFMDGQCNLIIAEPIAQAMDWSGFPDFEYNRLPVLERPLDGMRLLGDPDWSAMDAN